jgi:hypothetical protein
MDRPHRVVANWASDYEQLFYFIIAIAVVVTIASVILVRRKMLQKGPSEAVAPSARTFCMFCGSDIDADARFCSKCGKAQVS